MSKPKEKSLLKDNQPRNEKRKTWKYVTGNTAKKLNLCLAIITIATSAIILLMGFLPAVTVKDISLGNFYYFTEIIIRRILSSVEFLSVEIIGTQLYNAIIFELTLVCAAIIIFGILLLFKGIAFLISYFKNEEVCVNKLDLKNIIFSIILSSILIFFLCACMLIWEKLFLFECPYQLIMAFIILAWMYLTIIIRVKFSKNCEKITKEKVYHLVNEEKNNKTTKQERNIIGFEKVLAIIMIILTLGVQVINSNVYFEPLLDGGFQLSEDPSFIGFYSVGDPIGYRYTHKLHGEEVIRIDFGETEEEKKSEYTVSWDVNYYFYQYQIEVLEKEKKELMPEKVSENATYEEIENALKEYTKKIEAIQEKIQTFKNILHEIPLPIETMRLEKDNSGKTVVREIIYDTRRIDKSQFKYGDKTPELFPMYTESISLEQKAFKFGTDFSKTNIVATITYKDGSIKTSKITPTNYSDLNSLSIGTHTIKWSDNWGEYSAEIIII